MMEQTESVPPSRVTVSWVHHDGSETEFKLLEDFIEQWEKISKYLLEENIIQEAINGEQKLRKR